MTSRLINGTLRGRYLIVRDRAEAMIVCDYIRAGGEARAELGRFETAVSGLRPGS